MDVVCSLNVRRVSVPDCYRVLDHIKKLFIINTNRSWTDYLSCNALSKREGFFCIGPRISTFWQKMASLHHFARSKWANHGPRSAKYWMNTTKYRTYNPRNAKNVDKYSVGGPHNIDYATMGPRYLEPTVRGPRNARPHPQKKRPGPRRRGLVLATYPHYRSKKCI